MAEERFDGWLFDAYPENDGMRVWALDSHGNHYSFLDPWLPSFYVGVNKNDTARLQALLRSLPYPTSTRWTERTELFSGHALSVFEIRVPPRLRDKTVDAIKGLGLDLYSADIHLVQQYHYDRGHFPLAKCAFEVRDETLVSWELRDDPWAIDYDLPPLRTVHLALSGSEVAGKVDPNHGIRGRLVLTFEGRQHELEGSAEEQIEALSIRLRQWDPDVIMSEWGDSVLIPQLDDLAGKLDMKIPFSRDGARQMGRRGERSFYTYGRVVYQNGARYLHGRWNLDTRNSFMLRETGLNGLLEIARIARIPVQRAGRCTIGTSLSSMQMAWAWRNGILIPMDKAQAEDFRPATELLVADKGGLVFVPPVGWYDNVVEYDFTSMYPQMMVSHNISPETVNCTCCPDNLVPEIGHNLCTRRRGLVPSVLAPILEKRAKYKVLAKTKGPNAAVYKARAAAHKWCLVCCFGYLGFKNARFGKIESHESVTAWGREVLLRAKEVVEARGFRMLHALVDSLWVQVAPGLNVEELRLAIEREAGCPLAVEGVYKWIRFCPSKMDSKSGVPARYFGAFKDGELKFRGLACRRHDTPRLLDEMQDELLRLLAGADDVVACRALLPRLTEVVDGFKAMLREGAVTAEDLAITFNLSKDPAEYVHDSLQALAAKRLAECGVKLHPGETVRYVIAASKEKVKEWRTLPLVLMEGPLEYDVGKYTELLERAAIELLDGIALPAMRVKKKQIANTPGEPELPLGWTPDSLR